MPVDEGLALREAPRSKPLGVHAGLPRCSRSHVWRQGPRVSRRCMPRGRSACSALHWSITSWSEENQEGWEHHDSSLVDSTTGQLEHAADVHPADPRGRSRGHGRRRGGSVAGSSRRIRTRRWPSSSSMAGACRAGAHRRAPDTEGDGRRHACHPRVFPDLADGGRPPYEQIYLPAESGTFFEEIGPATGSLR